jgi:biopolymer transport protein ExbD
MKKGGSRLARRQARNHARYRGRNDLNIVPMLDVMVILTFFLIFTAVFSKTSIVEVNLPGPEVQAPPAVPTLELEVILRSTGIEVADRNVGVLQTIPLTATGYQDALRLSENLAEIKNRFPDKTNATLLVADDVDYDTIVQVMDAMRVRQTVEGTKVSSTTLFPQISLGDAPVADAPAGDAPQ